MEETKAPQIPPFVPVMTVERFAQMFGLEEGVIQGHIRRGYLPTIKLGRQKRIQSPRPGTHVVLHGHALLAN
ncbi:MAG: helix-turn-helix domain-containing protein [Alteromonadaceae bacterium]|nr:helix-turn-helix domain-containing protein [Alteromonadaceae bacterium]